MLAPAKDTKKRIPNFLLLTKLIYEVININISMQQRFKKNRMQNPVKEKDNHRIQRD